MVDMALYRWLKRVHCALQVPVLTPASRDLLAPGSLVRYRGMVQDMLNPEFYLGVYQHKNSAGETVWLQPRHDPTPTTVVSRAKRTTHPWCAPRPRIGLAHK